MSNEDIERDVKALFDDIDRQVAAEIARQSTQRRLAPFAPAIAVLVMLIAVAFAWRAYDLTRRRFVPSIDGLEPRIAPGRALPVAPPIVSDPTVPRPNPSPPPEPTPPPEPSPGPFPGTDPPIEYPPPPLGGPVGPA